jgi:hypothetical protein
MSFNRLSTMNVGVCVFQVLVIKENNKNGKILSINVLYKFVPQTCT